MSSPSIKIVTSFGSRRGNNDHTLFQVTFVNNLRRRAADRVKDGSAPAEGPGSNPPSQGQSGPGTVERSSSNPGSNSNTATETATSVTKEASRSPSLAPEAKDGEKTRKYHVLPFNTNSVFQVLRNS